MFQQKHKLWALNDDLLMIIKFYQNLYNSKLPFKYLAFVKHEKSSNIRKHSDRILEFYMLVKMCEAIQTPKQVSEFKKQLVCVNNRVVELENKNRHSELRINYLEDMLKRLESMTKQMKLELELVGDHQKKSSVGLKKVFIH